MDSNQRNILVDNLHKLSTEQVEEFLVVNGYFDPVDFPHNLAKLLLKHAGNLTITDTLYDLYISAILPSLVAVTNIKYTTEQIKNMSDDNLTIFANILHLTYVKDRSTLKLRILRILSFAGLINRPSEELPMDAIKIMGLHTPYYKLTNFCIATQACDIYFWMYKLTHDLGITNEEFEVMKLTQPHITTNVDTIRHQYFTIKTGCNNLALTKGSSEYIPFFLDSYLNIMDEIKVGNYLKAVELLLIKGFFKYFHKSIDHGPMNPLNFNAILYYTILFLRHKHIINLYNVLPLTFPESHDTLHFVQVLQNIHPYVENYNKYVKYNEITYSEYVYHRKRISPLVVTNIMRKSIADYLYIAAYVIGNKTLQAKLIKDHQFTEKGVLRQQFIGESIRGDLKSYRKILKRLLSERSYVDSKISIPSLMFSLLFGHMNLVTEHILVVPWDPEDENKRLRYVVTLTHSDKIDEMIHIFELLDSDEGFVHCFRLCFKMHCYEKIPYMINKFLERYDIKEESEHLIDLYKEAVNKMIAESIYLLANEDGTVNIYVYRAIKTGLNLLEQFYIEREEEIYSPSENIREIMQNSTDINSHAAKIAKSLGLLP